MIEADRAFRDIRSLIGRGGVQGKQRNQQRAHRPAATNQAHAKKVLMVGLRECIKSTSPEASSGACGRFCGTSGGPRQRWLTSAGIDGAGSGADDTVKCVAAVMQHVS